MAEKKDDKEFQYISALQDFNKSVGYLIKAVQAQVAKKQDFKSSVADTAEQFKQMATMAEQLTVIVENTASTKEDTKKILQVVEGLKKQKKTGIWDKLSPKDKTKGVGEGIKTVVLMAAGILAIGAAFKVIGGVDFTSVLALSIALPLITMAFANMDETLKPKDAAILSLNLIIMSVGIVGSGYVLKMMPEIGFKQLISVIGVAIGMGIAMYGLALVAHHINAKDVGSMLLMAAVLPAMALGIVLSAKLLANIEEIPFMKLVETTAGITIATTIAGLGMLLLDKLGFNGIKAIEGSLAMIAVAGGLLASSLILANIEEIPFMKLVETTAGITIATTIAGLGMLLLDKLGFNGIKAIEGSLAMIAVAGGLLASSLILAKGDYTKYPSLEWGLNAGVVLLGGGLLALGMGSFLGQIIPGVIGIIAVAGGILASSLILAQGDYSKYPSLDWAKGVGLSMGAFGLSAIALGAVISTGVGAIVLGFGIAGMLGLSEALVGVSHIIKGGDYSTYPSLEWSEGVGTGISAFTNAITKIAPGPLDLLFGDSMDKRIESIVQIGDALKRVSFVVKGGDYTGGPKADWSMGVGLALFYFTDALDKIKPSFMEKWALGETTDQQIELMVKLASSLHRIGDAVGTDASVYQGGPKEEWAKGVGGSLLAFSQALSEVSPGIIGTLLGETLQGQINGMIAIAAALPLIGAKIGTDTTMYTGGPDEKWAKGVGNSILLFSKAMGEFGGITGISINKVPEILEAMKLIAPVIPFIGTEVSKGDYSKYPDAKWAEGIGEFFTVFSKLKVINNPQTAADGISLLASSYNELARSLTTLSTSMKGITEMPDLTALYGGIVTLSIIDKDNLGDVLDKLNDKQSEFSKVFDMIRAQSSVKIDESTFAFNKDKKETKTSGGKIGGGTSAASAFSNMKPGSNIPTINKSETVKSEGPTKMEILMQKMVQIQGQMNSLMQEVADNTSHKLATSSGNLIDN